jgi:hypothetical protein
MHSVVMTVTRCGECPWAGPYLPARGLQGRPARIGRRGTRERYVAGRSQRAMMFREAAPKKRALVAKPPDTCSTRSPA